MRKKDVLERILECVKPYEFDTFVIGFARPANYERTAHEAVYREMKNALGDEIVQRIPGVDVDFEHPQLRIDIDEHGTPAARPAPIFVAGRYRKLSREIPASRWIHHACRGRGCPSCSHTGTLCGPSIEELLAEPVLRYSGGKKALFHALGREDTDARMLGDGRPFVLEVQDPLRRMLPLDCIGRDFAARAEFLAEIRGLALVRRPAVKAVKGASAEKTYRAWVRIEGEPPADTKRRVDALSESVIAQMSPRRVMHRRGRGTCRERRLVESAWGGELEGLFLWEVRVESGMYVKELVSGDGGRTRPSLSEILGLPCECRALDVLQIHWTPPWEEAPETGITP